MLSVNFFLKELYFAIFETDCYMPQLEDLRIKNFRALKNVTIGKLWNRQEDEAVIA